MSKRLDMHVGNVIWSEAFDQYAEDCGGELWTAPKYVQFEYKLKAAERISQKLNQDVSAARAEAWESAQR